MWQFPALLFLFLPGCCTAQDPVTGPEEVSGQEQGSLTVQCRYDSGWKDYKKYWCRGAYWKSCEILVETDASEQLVKENRVSIRDDQTDFIFTVTMEDLRMSDADIYWCGITKAGTDPMFKVNVNIDPEISTTIMTTTATVLPSTVLPSTVLPSTVLPSTVLPSTVLPSTVLPFTVLPSTVLPSTVVPSTVLPSTVLPSTVLPSTVVPSTVLTSTVLTSTTPTMESIGTEKTGQLTQNSLFIWSLLSSISFLLMVFVVVPLLLSRLCAVRWVNRPQRHYGEVEIGLVETHRSDAQDEEKHFPGDEK